MAEKQTDQVINKEQTNIPIKPQTNSIQEDRRFQTSENDGYGCIELVGICLSVFLQIITFPLSVFLSFKVVTEYQRAVILRMGRLRSGGARGPGLIFIIPCIDQFYKVDLRTKTYCVPAQEVLTKDSVSILVDAVVYYKIINPLDAVVQIANYAYTTQLLAATTLRNVLGSHNLFEVLTERESMARTMQISLDEATDRYGVKIERIEIKNVSLPQQMQRAMAAEAEASRGARAKIIAAEGEMKASQKLTEASNILAESPMSLQLRYLQTLFTIAAEQDSTILFPLPMNLFTNPTK